MISLLNKVNTKTRGVFNLELERGFFPFLSIFLKHEKSKAFLCPKNPGEFWGWLNDKISFLPYEPVGRIIQEMGAERVSHEAKVALAEYLEEYAIKLCKLAVKYAEHAGRTTVMDKDILLAEKNLEQ